MVRPNGRVVVLIGLVACTRTTQVDSLAQHVAGADRLRLRSGERVPVDRIVSEDVDSMTIVSEGGARRIALDDVIGVEHRDRGRGFLQGARAGAVLGGVAGIGTGLLYNSTCEDDPVDGWDVPCGTDAVILGGLVGLAGMVVLGLVGGGIGAAQGHTDQYLRRLPVTVAPTRDGVSALWTIEF